MVKQNTISQLKKLVAEEEFTKAAELAEEIDEDLAHALYCMERVKSASSAYKKKLEQIEKIIAEL